MGLQFENHCHQQTPGVVSGDGAAKLKSSRGGDEGPWGGDWNRKGGVYCVGKGYPETQADKFNSGPRDSPVNRNRVVTTRDGVWGS